MNFDFSSIFAIVCMIIYIIIIIGDKKKKRISTKQWIILTILAIISIMLGILGSMI